MASGMLGTRLVGGAADVLTLEEIFSAVVSVFKHVFLYSQKNELFSSFSSVTRGVLAFVFSWL